MQLLELRVPPVALFLVAAAVMGGLAVFTGTDRITFPGQLLAASVLLLAAGLVGLASVRVFARHETTVNPLRPERASRLVAAGIYRYSRNPMYLSLLLALAAWATWLGSIAAAVVLPVFAGAMTRWQIRPEERALAALFGDEFEAYRRRVRRWL
ncbi:isoprenylcysteine carboxylmethyltransferase family protein [Thioalkalivibrio sp. XN279]|uniref:methyltransferase family protein n=1 Tax=Thioalkalivibrio sp. XN279 TaxID=2714953 RepID=UPI00140890A0|nr:isoprenylcysteine carboxylmethyltransferase family protein [Thioalkalivibrio sp. XN279]NHA14886.1 isoprenylcysteine carboxylmethyltransferase family protein [Thioalkalivibrio sp. XN279]